MNASTLRDLLQEGRRANADLYSWGVVVTHLESAEAPSEAHYSATKKVIAIAKTEMQKALERMDAADAKLQRAQADQKGGLDA